MVLTKSFLLDPLDGVNYTIKFQFSFQTILKAYKKPRYQITCTERPTTVLGVIKLVIGQTQRAVAN